MGLYAASTFVSAPTGDDLLQKRRVSSHIAAASALLNAQPDGGGSKPRRQTTSGSGSLSPPLDDGGSVASRSRVMARPDAASTLSKVSLAFEQTSAVALEDSMIRRSS